MTQLIENQQFFNHFDNDSGRIFSDLEFRDCRFVNCVLSNTRDPRLRSIVRNVRLVDCAVDCCHFNAAIVEDVAVQNLKSTDTVRTSGAAFKHVTLRGRFNDLILGPSFTGTAPFHIKAIDDANLDYYKTVDWALDIREIDCKECDIRGIPSDLVRRDPRTQAIVRREKALELGSRSFDLGETGWTSTIAGMLEDGYLDCVLVAGKRSRHFARLVKGIQLLRAAGIAEAD